MIERQLRPVGKIARAMGKDESQGHVQERPARTTTRSSDKNGAHLNPGDYRVCEGMQPQSSKIPKPSVSCPLTENPLLPLPSISNHETSTRKTIELPAIISHRFRPQPRMQCNKVQHLAYIGHAVRAGKWEYGNPAFDVHILCYRLQSDIGQHGS